MSWLAKRRERKAAKRIAAARAARDGTHLAIIPPEGVPLRFRVAGIGARLGAQIVDFLVTLVAALVLGFALVWAFALDARTGSALIGLIAFLTRVPYYVVLELIWNGRTLAKRWMGLRTVSRDGRSLRAYQIVVRNLMREIEFFSPIIYLMVGLAVSGWVALGAFAWIVILVVVPWRSPINQRLGDIIAGTAVIEEPKAQLLGDLTAVPQTVAADERFVFTTEQLDAYGAYELQVLERLLRPPPVDGAPSREMLARRQATLEDVATRIIAKIGYRERVPARETEAFLQSFYRAERAYLESRKLFGDSRADKTYRERVEGG